MKLLNLLIVSSLLFGHSVFAAYDAPFSVEFHVGPSFPSDDIRDTDVDTGFGFGSSFSYHFLNGRLGAYAGFDFQAFEADSLSNTNVETVWLYGYEFGMSHQGNFGNLPLGYFARVGLHYSQLGLLDDDDDELRETKYDTGFQTSAGIDYHLGTNWALRAGVQYKTFSNKFKRSPNTSEAELDTVKLLFGGSYSF